MGNLALKLLLSRRRRQKRQARSKPSRLLLPLGFHIATTPVCFDGSITSKSRRKRPLLSGEDGSSLLGVKRLRDAGPVLPEEIWCHVHSLMPMQDSARAACVSHTFLNSWRRRPNLILTKEALGLKKVVIGKGDIPRPFASQVDKILRNHSGTGVKILELDISDCRDLDTCHLDNWLQIAIAPGIEELTLELPREYMKVYTFPCSLLFGQNGSFLRSLQLSYCAFRPTVANGSLRSLTELCLDQVRVTGEELGQLLSNSFALKELELSLCNEIICLKVPCVLEQLSCLTVLDCDMLQVIESEAPNLSTFDFGGNLVQLSLGRSLVQVKNVVMECLDEPNFLCYAITKLPYVVPSVEDLTLLAIVETANNIPMAAGKFLHLKYLEICPYDILSAGYDFLSLVSFLDASPVLETFIFCLDQDDVDQADVEFVSVFENASNMRQIPGHKHGSLKNVTMLGFCSAKSLVELTCHILKNASSLECMTLDTVFDKNDEERIGRCSLTGRTDKCSSLSNEMILKAKEGLMAIERYIKGKVPSTVELDVRGPCSRCHT
ncbi:hypothetical protein ACP4OV_009894 [Aristida adscensionis]